MSTHQRPHNVNTVSASELVLMNESGRGALFGQVSATADFKAPTRPEVDALMKRCQRGVGGRNALDDAHSIMAECYGTLGALMLRVEILESAGRQQLRQLSARRP